MTVFVPSFRRGGILGDGGGIFLFESQPTLVASFRS